jgi:hypothetical protein
VNAEGGEKKVTPLMYAMSYKISAEPSVVQALVDYGADINAKDSAGQSVSDYSKQANLKDKVAEYAEILLAAKQKNK